MKLLFKSCIFFLFSANAYSLDWVTKELEISTTTSKDKYEAHFEFTNNSAKEISFLKVQASCGCIIVNTPKTIASGKSGKITFKAPVPLGGGTYSKVIVIDTDETDKVEYTLKFKIKNTDPRVIRPPRIVQEPLKKASPKYVPVTSYIRPAKMTARSLLVEKLKAKQALMRKRGYYEQDECPFLPLPINKKLYHDFEGMRIYTCCEQCLKLVKESPYHAIIKLSEKTQTPILIKTLKTLKQ